MKKGIYRIIRSVAKNNKRVYGIEEYSEIEPVHKFYGWQEVLSDDGSVFKTDMLGVAEEKLKSIRTKRGEVVNFELKNDNRTTFGGKVVKSTDTFEYIVVEEFDKMYIYKFVTNEDGDVRVFKDLVVMPEMFATYTDLERFSYKAYNERSSTKENIELLNNLKSGLWGKNILEYLDRKCKKYKHEIERKVNIFGSPEVTVSQGFLLCVSDYLRNCLEENDRQFIKNVYELELERATDKENIDFLKGLLL